MRHPHGHNKWPPQLSPWLALLRKPCRRRCGGTPRRRRASRRHRRAAAALPWGQPTALRQRQLAAPACMQTSAAERMTPRHHSHVARALRQLHAENLVTLGRLWPSCTPLPPSRGCTCGVWPCWALRRRLSLQFDTRTGVARGCRSTPGGVATGQQWLEVAGGWPAAAAGLTRGQA